MLKSQEIKLDESIDKDTLILASRLSKGIEVLGLSVRAYNALIRCRWDVRTVGDLCGIIMDGKAKRIRNIGEKSIYEIEDALTNYIKVYQRRRSRLRASKTYEKTLGPVMPEGFWEDWMQATGALRGDIKLTRAMRRRWESDVAAWYDKNKEKGTV